MIITKGKIFLIVMLFLIMLPSCVTAPPPPLPERLEIIPPAPDVTPEIAAFSGVWEGQWGAMKGIDTIVAIEKIDNRKAEILFSFGGETPGQVYFIASVLPGPVLEWEIEKFPNDPENETGCHCKLTFKMNKELDILVGFIESISYKLKIRADMTRHKGK